MDKKNKRERSMNQQPPPSHHQPPPSQKCPRCNSSNTKFCYYNNYSLTQPRYFCKACRRYWTHGGTLRNVPVGGGCRKNKWTKTYVGSSPDSDISTSHSLLATSQNYSCLDPGRAYTGSPNTVTPQMAAVQPLPAGNNQGVALSLHNCGQLAANNMSLLRGMNVSSFNQSLIPPWMINSGPVNSPAGRSTFWSGATTVRASAQAACSSLNPNKLSASDNNKEFNPSQ